MKKLTLLGITIALGVGTMSISYAQEAIPDTQPQAEVELLPEPPEPPADVPEAPGGSADDYVKVDDAPERPIGVMEFVQSSEDPRMDVVTTQLTGKLSGINKVSYGGGTVHLPVVKSDDTICVSIINSMAVLVENPTKASDYSYQIAVHCDEIEAAPIVRNGKTIKDRQGKPIIRSKSKGFAGSYVIELDKGIKMHSVKFTSGTLKIWPKAMYEDWLVENDKEVKVALVEFDKYEKRRNDALAELNSRRPR